MLRPHRVSVILAFGFALSACKVELNTSTNADDAKANADDAKANVDAAAGDADAAAGDADAAAADAEAAGEVKDPSTTLSAGAAAGDASAEPAAGDAAADPSTTLTASPGATCGDHKAGDTWKDDCNNCRCTDAGELMCTRMKCAPDAGAR